MVSQYAAGVAAELVRYQRWGGYAGLSQHLRVDEDGLVRLSDRKSGTRTEVLASANEVAGLRAAIDSVPASRWHSLVGALVRRALPRSHEAMRFQVQVGPRRIGGAAGSTEADVAPLLAQLDELLARAVREGRPDTNAAP